MTAIARTERPTISEFVHHIRFFKDNGIDDAASVGDRNASPGEMYRELTPLGVRIPNGFAVVADAYWYVLDRSGALPALQDVPAGLARRGSLRRRSILR